MKLWRLLVFAAAAAVLALPAAALAQVDPNIQHDGFSAGTVQGFFSDRDGDPLTQVYLAELFGPLFGGTAATVFSRIIGYFNIIALVLGGLLFAWNATAGLLQTAHEGELLGRRWSSLWAPLRVVFAVGLLVPLPHLKGYNAAQAGVAYIVAGASLSASFVWRQAASLVLVGQVPVAAAPPRLPADVIRTVYGQAVCEILVTRQLADGPWRFDPGPWRLAGSGASRQLERAPAVVRGPARRPVCGTIRTPAFPADGRTWLEWQGLDQNDVQAVVRQFRERHAALLDALRVDMLALARAQAVGLYPGADGALADALSDALAGAMLANAVRQANGALSALAESLFSATGELSKGADANRGRQALRTISGGLACAVSSASPGECFGSGWTMAGSWYVEFARLNAQMTSLTRSVPEAEPDRFFARHESEGLLEDIHQWVRRLGKRDAGRFLEHEAALRQWDWFHARYDTAARQLAVLGLADRGESIAAPDDDGWSIRSLFTSFSGIGLGDAVQVMADFLLAPGEDPLAGLMAWGEWLLWAAGGLSAALTVAPGAAAWMPATGTLWAAGALLQIILPLMPWVLWVVGVTGYFLLVVEAVIGVTLWAFAHMKLEGEGLSGSATNGWTLLLALLLTPVLMVFGFVVGMMIFRVTSGLLLAGIVPAATSILAPASAITVVIALPALAVFIAVMQLVLIERSFSLVTELPNRVLSWIGGRADLADQGALDRTRVGMIGATASLPRAMPGPQAVGAAGGAVRRLFRRRDGEAGGPDNRTTGE